MANKPQLFSNLTYTASKFVENVYSISLAISATDANTNSRSASATSRQVWMFPQDGDSLYIVVGGDTLSAGNFATVNTTPVYTVTEVSRIEDVTHHRSLQVFYVDNVANGSVVVQANWGTTSPIPQISVRTIGNTSGYANMQSNNWQTLPTTAANGVTTGLTGPTPDVPVYLVALTEDTAANNSDPVSGGNGWTQEGLIFQASTLTGRFGSKIISSANAGDSCKFTASVNEDHLSVVTGFMQKHPIVQRVYSNNTVQVGQLIEVAGSGRAQLCSNGSYITTKFVEG